MSVRGYANWNPKAETVELIDNVRRVLREYDEFAPLTLRQVFYILVGDIGYEKTERAYGRLASHVARARRAKMIDFNAIREEVSVSRRPYAYADPAAFWAETRANFDNYRRDRLQTQPYRMELWCETPGMLSQLQRIAFPYSIVCNSSQGYASVTVTKAIADRTVAAGKPTVLLHVGDYDPSGENIAEVMYEDAEVFTIQESLSKIASEEGAGARQTAHDAWMESDWDAYSGPRIIKARLALTGEQVREYELETAPPKSSDSRSVEWTGGETCQLESMPPDVLVEVVEAGIREHLDVDLYEEQVTLEESDRDEIEFGLERAQGDDE